MNSLRQRAIAFAKPQSQPRLFESGRSGLNPAFNGHTFRKACTMNRSQHPSAPTLIKITGIVLLGIASSVFARDRDDRFDARLKSFKEVPAVSSTATGRFRAVFDEKANPPKIEYDLSYSGLEGIVTQAHIHLGQRGVNGGIMVWLCQTATIGTRPDWRRRVPNPGRSAVRSRLPT